MMELYSAYDINMWSIIISFVIVLGGFQGTNSMYNCSVLPIFKIILTTFCFTPMCITSVSEVSYKLKIKGILVF